MRCKWSSTPEPGYEELVIRLYGSTTGGELLRAYRDQLSRRDLWEKRLDWSGVAVYDGGEIVAHAVVQAVKDRPLVYVGFVEAVDDREVAACLVEAIREKLIPERTGKI